MTADAVKNNARTPSYLSGVRISPRIICEFLPVTAEDKHPENGTLLVLIENGTFTCFYSLQMKGRYSFKLNITYNILSLIFVAFSVSH